MNRFHRNARFALLLAVVMVLSAFSMTAFAATKTLTVDPNGEFDTIQKAIDYIGTQADKTNWTIVVNAGDYGRFTVLSGLDGLTVCAAADALVTVSTIDGSKAPAPVSGGHPDTKGISIRDADHVTLDGLVVKLGDNKDGAWFASGVSSYTQSSKGNDFTVRNCVFDGNGVGYGCFFDSGVTEFHIQNCIFNNVFEAVEMMCDGTVMGDSDVTSCIFNNCSFAVHGYYGGTGKSGTFNIVDNDIVGTPDLYSKVVVMDQYNTGAMKVNVSGNTFTNALVGNVNLREEGESNDVRKYNKFDINSFYVEAIEPGTIEFYSTYHAPEGSYGHWELTHTDGLEHIDIIQAAIEEANKNHSHVLSITGIPDGELIKTFTWFKDCIYWVADPIPETGDNSSIALWSVMCVLSMGVIVMMAAQKRKNYER